MTIQDVAKFLINPVFPVIIGLLALLFARKHRTKITLLLIAYVYLASITYTGRSLLRAWKIDDTYRPGRMYDAVVVLAGVSNAKWHIERKGIPYIPDDFFASDESSDRILAGINFVKSGHARRLLIGDWIYKTYDEGRAVGILAAEMGLRKDQLQIYGRVERTLDEAKGVKRYAEKHPLRNILLVTSAAHMRRALAMFRKQGLTPDVFSVNKEKREITWKSFVPKIEGLKKTKSFLHEFVGYIGYLLKGDL